MPLTIQNTRPNERLAVYGSLRPGESNQHVLTRLRGVWVTGLVRGMLRHGGWGAGEGYPGLVLSDNAPSVPVEIFCSPNLPAFWTELDAFEGAELLKLDISSNEVVGLRRYR